MQRVSVIIPTLARSDRGAELLRAIESVHEQAGVAVRAIVVVNGLRRDPAVVARLRADRRLEVLESTEPGIPAALHRGRQAVDSRWVCALDDDDLLLPGALAARVEFLAAHPDYTAVVSNGYRRNGSGDVVHLHDLASLERDPMGELLRRNWLLPGSWLSHTDTIDPQFFAQMPRFLECTYVAVRLAMTGRLKFLEEPSVVWFTGKNDSESRSRHHALGQPAAIRQMLELPLPSSFARGLRREAAAACHANADLLLGEGRLAAAWQWHLQSLLGTAGYRYAFYTRHLLAAAVGVR